MNDQPHGTTTVLRRVLWFGVALLAVVGITAAIGRSYSVATGGLSYSQISRMLPAQIVQEAYDFDRWFLSYPLLTFLHVIPGGLLLALAPLQFSSRIRNQHLRFHRWSGRVLVLSALLVGLSGLLLAARFPYGGPVAAAASFVAGTAFLIALIRAFIAIRRRDVVAHREWMIRMFALGLAIATIRVIGLLVFALTGTSFQKSAGAVFWIGWVSTFTVAELWIRHTRPGRVASAPTPVTVTQA
jgi:uncharacterized membrane protein